MNYRFDIKIEGRDGEMETRTVTDRRTGVQYMVVTASHGYGQGANTNVAVTPLLNPDGALCTKDRA